MPEELPPASSFADGTQIHFDAEGADVILDPTALNVMPMPVGHDSNLAECIPESELTRIAEKIVEWRDTDKDARKDWEKRLGEALKLLGVEDLDVSEVNGIAGASKVGHPLLAEIAVQFQARAMEECFPSTGPVKTVVVGRSDEARVDQAQRVEDYMNYHLTEVDPEYYDDTDQMLFLLPLHGSIFRKIYVDPVTELEVGRFCEASRVYVPYSAKSIRSAPRITHEFTMAENDIKRAIANGFYRDVDLTESTPLIDTAQQAKDTADDRTETYAESDNDQTLLECHCNLSLSCDGGALLAFDLPYIVTVSDDGNKVMSIRRNWREHDPKFRKRMWWAHYKYLPGFGIYGFGLLHLVGVMAKVAGGSIRALLDAAARSNWQGGFKTKDAKVAGEVVLEMGKYKDVDQTAEELSKSFWSPDFKEPSQTLFRLLEYIVDNARRFGSVTEAMVGDSAPTGPVGTMLAIIEQGSKVFSGIHKRIHKTLRSELKMLSDLIGERAPPYYPYEVEGAPKEIMRQDFSANVDVLPVSDPSIFSSTQRISLAQATMELAEKMPDVFKGQASRKEVAKRMLKALKIPNPEALMPPKPPRLDPVTENQLILTARPVQAAPEQDHQAHMAVHMNFLHGLAEEQAKAVVPMMLAHVAEHQAHLYRLQAMGTMQVPQQDLDNPKELPLAVETFVAQMVAQNHVAAPGIGATGGGGPPPEEAMAQIQEQAKQLQQQQQDVLKKIQELEDLHKQVEDQQRALAGEKMKMNSAHEAFLATADNRKNELATAQRAAEVTIQQKQTQLDRLLSTIDAKMERIKDMTEGLKQAMKEAPPPNDETKAQFEKLMGELVTVGEKVVETLASPREKVVTKRDAAGRIATVSDTVK